TAAHAADARDEEDEVVEVAVVHGVIARHASRMPIFLGHRQVFEGHVEAFGIDRRLVDQRGYPGLVLSVALVLPHEREFGLLTGRRGVADEGEAHGLTL